MGVAFVGHMPKRTFFFVVAAGALSVACGDGNGGSGGSGGGDNTSLHDACQVAADCQGWDAGELGACEGEATIYANVAVSAGCSADLNGLDACLDGMTCNSGNIEHNCGPLQVQLDQCVDDAVNPPIDTVCDAAADICGGGSEGEGEQVDCSGLVLCVSQCILQFGSCTAPEVADCAADC